MNVPTYEQIVDAYYALPVKKRRGAYWTMSFQDRVELRRIGNGTSGGTLIGCPVVIDDGPIRLHPGVPWRRLTAGALERISGWTAALARSVQYPR